MQLLNLAIFNCSNDLELNETQVARSFWVAVFAFY